MSTRTHSPLALVLASAALGVSLGAALWMPLSNRSCSHIHAPPAPAVDSPSPPCGLVATPVTDWTPPPPPTTLQLELGGLLPATAGQPSRPGDLALARWSDGNWWEARVEAASGDTVRVAWLDGSPANDLPREHVAPLPHQRPALQHGALAMCKWSTSTRWWRARIHGEGDARTVLYIDGTTEPLTGQCVPAERSDLGFYE
jgi:hypothetical protein